MPSPKVSAGLNLDGAVFEVHDSLNKAYYGKDVTPVDIIAKKDVMNKRSVSLREVLKKAV